MARAALKATGKLMPAIHPNAGIRAQYAKRLVALIREMSTSYEHWLRAQYRKTPPRMAEDALPAAELERLLKEMGSRWQSRFDSLASRLAEHFARSVRGQTERRLKAILRESGITVRFTMTPELRDIMRAEVAENVGLIKSIPQYYHTQVQGLVMRSVTAGRDLSTLTKELQERYGVTERRAHFIALDQNNKATSSIRRERELAAKIDEGVWMHSHAGREPRPTHVKNNGKRFSLKDGWYDSDPKVRRKIWPGELPRCRCVWRAVVPGFS